MRILFCKIAHMKYYKGICGNDKPYNGGDYVKKQVRQMNSIILLRYLSMIVKEKSVLVFLKQSQQTELV